MPEVPEVPEAGMGGNVWARREWTGEAGDASDEAVVCERCVCLQCRANAVLAAAVVRGGAVHRTVPREHHAHELADAGPDAGQPRCVRAVGECADFEQEWQQPAHRAKIKNVEMKVML